MSVVKRLEVPIEMHCAVMSNRDFIPDEHNAQNSEWSLLPAAASVNDHCRLTNYELLRWLVETPSRDFAHYRLSGGRPDMLQNIYNLSPVTSWHVDTSRGRGWHVVNILRKWSHEFDSRPITKSNVIFCMLFLFTFSFLFVGLSY